ncbi:MAG: DNA primase [Lachnospiraceae bacterium]|nr:DNA primase [Lachnospiraceae bacterium]
MPIIPREQIDEVLSRTDIVDIIGSSVNLKRAGNGYVGLCPFHNEKTPSFHVNPQMQIYKCFGCNNSGNVITFLMEHDNMTFVEAVEYLADKAGVTLQRQGGSKYDKEANNRKNALYEINKEAAKYYFGLLKTEEGKNGYNYFKSRGLTDHTIVKYGLGYSGKGGRRLYDHLKNKGYSDGILMDSKLFKKDGDRPYEIFWNRVMFPIIDKAGHVIGFGGRVLSDAKPKYLNSIENEIFSKRKNLFSMNLARKTRKSYLILCEGYMDVIALYQAGFDCAVASLGTSLTDEQVSEMKRFTKNVYLTYDSDEAGTRAAMRAIPMLRNGGITPKVINLKPYKDPDELIKALGADEFNKRIETAENGFFFECDYIRNSYNLSDPDELSNCINEIAELVVLLDDEVKGDAYIKSASDRYDMDEKTLRLAVRKIRAKDSGVSIGRTPVVAASRNNDIIESKTSGGLNKAYAMVLSWLLREPGDYNKISHWIKPEDFLDKDYRELARKIYSQLDNNSLNPASIISNYEDSSEQMTVASVLQTDFDFQLPKEEKEKALIEMLTMILKHSIREKMHEASKNNDLDAIMKLGIIKKKLEKPGYVTLNNLD